MRRLLVLAVLALAPLFAAAHEGHHEPAQDVQANDAVFATVAAPSRCPGGDHEVCCCHDATCTPSFQPVAMDEHAAEVAAPARGAFLIVERRQAAPRTVALDRHAPRGPPVPS